MLLGGFAALAGRVTLDAVDPAIRDAFSGAVAGQSVAAAIEAEQALQEGAVVKRLSTIKPGPGLRFRYDFDHCRGCGASVAECPCGAIEMVPEHA